MKTFLRLNRNRIEGKTSINKEDLYLKHTSSTARSIHSLKIHRFLFAVTIHKIQID